MYVAKSDLTLCDHNIVRKEGRNEGKVHAYSLGNIVSVKEATVF
jgi:hypothetical protein